MTVRQRLAAWLEANPDAWLTETYESIAKQTDMSAGSVNRHLLELVADRENILPSDVKKRRQEAGHVHQRRTKTDPDKIRKVIKDNPGADPRDWAYLVGCHPTVIERFLKENPIGSENDEAINEDPVDAINDRIGQIEGLLGELKKQLAKVSKD